VNATVAEGGLAAARHYMFIVLLTFRSFVGNFVDAIPDDMKTHTQPNRTRGCTWPMVIPLFASLILSLTGPATSGAPLPPAFRESFRASLGEFWCENHLDVADLDGDASRRLTGVF